MKPDLPTLSAALLFALAQLLVPGHARMLSPTPITNAAVSPPTPTSCRANGALPDPTCTPGATNTDVTQENISQNICDPKWTKSVRPPTKFTDDLKIQQIKAYGYSDTNPKDYEEDHFISLEIGGNPTDPKNLWPEAYNPKPGAREKDKVEDYLHGRVCSGAMTLVDAQKAIATDWLKIYNEVSK